MEKFLLFVLSHFLFVYVGSIGTQILHNHAVFHLVEILFSIYVYFTMVVAYVLFLKPQQQSESPLHCGTVCYIDYGVQKTGLPRKRQEYPFKRYHIKCFTCVFCLWSTIFLLETPFFVQEQKDWEYFQLVYQLLFLDVKYVRSSSWNYFLEQIICIEWISTLC